MVKSLATGETIRVVKDDLMQQVQHVEKKAFPRREALDFSIELQKRNVDFVVIVDDDAGDVATPARPKLVAYMVFAHLKAGDAVLLHKICVDGEYRRRGIARVVLETQVERLKKQGCTKIQLWVHERNAPARGLYNRLYFEEVCVINDYYAPGRNGIKMELSTGVLGMHLENPLQPPRY